MPATRGRVGAGSAENLLQHLLQQLSSAQDFDTWYAAVQQVGPDHFAHARIKHVVAYTMSELDLHVKAASNSLRLWCKDIATSGVDGDRFAWVTEILSMTNDYLRTFAVEHVLAHQDQQQLLKILSESGIDQHLASAIQLVLSSVETMTVVAEDIDIFRKYRVLLFFSSNALLGVWVCLSDACYYNKLGTATLEQATIAAIQLAGQMPALLQRIKSAATCSDKEFADERQIAKAAGQLYNVTVAVCRNVISSQQMAQALAASQLLELDELLPLLLVLLGCQTHSCQAMLHNIMQSEQQQQQQPPKGTPPHIQLLTALGATWTLNATCDDAMDQLGSFFNTCASLQLVLYCILKRRCSGSSSDLSVPVLPEHLQLPLLKVLIELSHLESQIRAKKQLGPCQACDLFVTLDLMARLVKLISSQQDSSSSLSSSGGASQGNNSSVNAREAAGPWPVLPAVVAAGLSKPVMQQLSKVVLDTLNSSSSNSSTATCSSSCSGDQSAAASAQGTADPSDEDDRRGVLFCYGNLLISLCLSVEPKHLAAALVPDVLTPITLLEAALRAQAVHIAPARWPDHKWFGAAACATGGNSVSSPWLQASVLDLSPVALQVLQSLKAAGDNSSFQTAVGAGAAASAMNDQQAVLLLKLFTLSVTCLKTIQAAAAAAQQEGGHYGPVAAAAEAASAFSSSLMCEPVWYATKAFYVASTATQRLSSSSKGEPPHPAALLPQIVLVARSLHLYVQQWLQQQHPQDQREELLQSCPAAAEAAAGVLQPCAQGGTAVSPSLAAEAAHSLESMVTRLHNLAQILSTCANGMCALMTVTVTSDVEEECLSCEPFSCWPGPYSNTTLACHMTQLMSTACHLQQKIARIVRKAADDGTAIWKAAASSQEAASIPRMFGQQHLQCIISIAKQLSDLSLSVCANIPLAVCCNNPDCHVLDKLGESQLVGGKECVCGGCGLARYCCRKCQKQHWSRHKRVCKEVKQQRAAATASGGGLPEL